MRLPVGDDIARAAKAGRLKSATLLVKYASLLPGDSVTVNVNGKSIQGIRGYSDESIPDHLLNRQRADPQGYVWSVSSTGVRPFDPKDKSLNNQGWVSYSAPADYYRTGDNAVEFNLCGDSSAQRAKPVQVQYVELHVIYKH